MREVMPPRDEMTIDERRKYVKLMAPRYQAAKRKDRRQLLSEMEQVSKLHRKHLIRLLGGQSLERKKRSTPRSRTYGVEVERVVLRVWESLDYICAERLTPVQATGDIRSKRRIMSNEEKIWGELIVSAHFPDRISPVACTAKESLMPVTPLSFFAIEPFCDMARASWQPAQFIRQPYGH
jgi:hypothetical protein